jgi:hypothetical protein
MASFAQYTNIQSGKTLARKNIARAVYFGVGGEISPQEEKYSRQSLSDFSAWIRSE